MSQDDSASGSGEEHIQAIRSKVDRERAVEGRADLVARIEAVLFRADPIGINFETNTDEYRAEAQLIVLRLHEADSIQDLHVIVHAEFVRWFGSQIAGPLMRYAAIAEEIWRNAVQADG